MTTSTPALQPVGPPEGELGTLPVRTHFREFAEDTAVFSVVEHSPNGVTRIRVEEAGSGIMPVGTSSRITSRAPVIPLSSGV